MGTRGVVSLATTVTWKPAGCPATPSTFSTLAMRAAQLGTKYPNQINRSRKSRAGREDIKDSQVLLFPFQFNPRQVLQVYSVLEHGFFWKMVSLK